MPTPIIMDCDPGNDDAVALLIAMASSEDLKILGITTVIGNVSLKQVTQNALKICELAGRRDIPVYAGCSRPIVLKEIPGDQAHGACGLEGSNLPDPTLKAQPIHAVDFIIDTLMNAKEKVTLCPTAPLTNLALAIVKEPRIVDNIEEIVLMGGSTEAGNITPAAEYNMYSDPHAAKVVFKSGAKITMIGLNVTHKILATPPRIEDLRNLNNVVGTQLANMMEASAEFDERKFGLKGRAIHDACVPLYLIKPELFTCKPAHVKVDIWHKENMGSTIISFYPGHLKGEPTSVAIDVNVDGVFDLMLNRLSRY